MGPGRFREICSASVAAGAGAGAVAAAEGEGLMRILRG